MSALFTQCQVNTVQTGTRKLTWLGNSNVLWLPVGFSVPGFSSKFLSILYFHLEKTCVKNVILALNLLNLYNIWDVSPTCWHLHHWAWAEPIVEEGLEFSVHTVPHHRRRNLLLWNKTYWTGRQGLGKVPLTVRAWTKRPNFILFFCLKLRILFFSQSDFSYKR